MKSGIAFLLFLLPVLAMGQSTTPADSLRRIDSLARVTLIELIDSWTLGIDSTSDAVDIKAFNRFKSLFDLNATVKDGFDVRYSNRSRSAGSYQPGNRQKPFDVYAHDVALEIKNIRKIDNYAIRDSNLTDKQNMRYTVMMNVDFQKARKYVLPDAFADSVIRNRERIRFENNEDSTKPKEKLNKIISQTQDSIYRFAATDFTFTVNMAFDAGAVKIRSLDIIANAVRCTNDSDLDAVLDLEDSASNKFGDFTANGRPDTDLDGVPDEIDKCRTTYGTSNHGCPASYFITKSQIDVFGGFQMNTQNINLPELDQMGYVDQNGNDAMDVLQSKKGLLQSPGQLAGIYGGAYYTYYIGRRKKRSGISIGFSYSTFAGQYSLGEPAVYTFKANDGVNFYRRQISIRQLTEDIGYTVFNVPLLFSYRFYLGKGPGPDKQPKSVVNIKIGPSYMMLQNTSNYNAVIDFGGLYQIDTILRNRITYYDYFNPASKYNLYLTSDRINSTNPASADSVFRQLVAKGYDLAYNKQYNGSQSLSRAIVAFNLNVDVQRQISEGLTLKLGAHVLYAPTAQGTAKYKPIDKTTDEFQSIYNSNVTSTYQAIGLNVGLVFNF